MALSPVSLDNLPDELHKAILSECTWRSLFRASQVCRLWRALVPEIVAAHFRASPMFGWKDDGSASSAWRHACNLGPILKWLFGSLVEDHPEQLARGLGVRCDSAEGPFYKEAFVRRLEQGDIPASHFPALYGLLSIGSPLKLEKREWDKFKWLMDKTSVPTENVGYLWLILRTMVRTKSDDVDAHLYLRLAERLSTIDRACQFGIILTEAPAVLVEHWDHTSLVSGRSLGIAEGLLIALRDIGNEEWRPHFESAIHPFLKETVRVLFRAQEFSDDLLYLCFSSREVQSSETSWVRCYVDCVVEELKAVGYDFTKHIKQLMDNKRVLHSLVLGKLIDEELIKFDITSDTTGNNLLHVAISATRWRDSTLPIEWLLSNDHSEALACQRNREGKRPLDIALGLLATKGEVQLKFLFVLHLLLLRTPDHGVAPIHVFSKDGEELGILGSQDIFSEGERNGLEEYYDYVCNE